MNYEPLKSILDLTDNKQNSIIFFLKDEIKSKMNNYYFYQEKDTDIFINQLIKELLINVVTMDTQLYF